MPPYYYNSDRELAMDPLCHCSNLLPSHIHFATFGMELVLHCKAKEFDMYILSEGWIIFQPGLYMVRSKPTYTHGNGKIDSKIWLVLTQKRIIIAHITYNYGKLLSVNQHCGNVHFPKTNTQCIIQYVYNVFPEWDSFHAEDNCMLYMSQWGINTSRPCDLVFNTIHCDMYESTCI